MSDPVFPLDALDTLLRWRRDVRHFRTDPLPDGLMDALLQRACLAPSVGFAQPWRFVRVQSPDVRARLSAHVDDCNTRAGAAYAEDPARGADYAALKLHGLREAPEVLGVFCDETTAVGHGLGRQTMPETLRYSVVCAVHTLWLAARARGVGVGWVSILEPAGVAQLLETPPAWRLVALLCLGYPEAASQQPELERCGWQNRLDPASLTRII